MSSNLILLFAEIALAARAAPALPNEQVQARWGLPNDIEKPNPAETPKNIKKKADPTVACNVWLGSFSTAQAIALRQGGSLLD